MNLQEPNLARQGLVGLRGTMSHFQTIYANVTEKIGNFSETRVDHILTPNCDSKQNVQYLIFTNIFTNLFTLKKRISLSIPNLSSRFHGNNSQNSFLSNF